jgi:hypothetical protein
MPIEVSVQNCEMNYINFHAVINSVPYYCLYVGEDEMIDVDACKLVDYRSYSMECTKE